MYTVKIREQWESQARDFAARTLESRMSRLRSRGQSSIDKITKDIIAGAVAEFGVRDILLTQMGYTDVSEPDMNLYVGKQKSFSADLQADTQQVHVKSYSNPMWASWVFTYNPERGDVDPLIEVPTENDYLALTYVNFNDRTVNLCYYIAAGTVINLYRPPILPQLRFSKLVLYPSDLNRLPHQQAVN